MSSVNSVQALPARAQRATPNFLSIRFTSARDLESVGNLFHGSRKAELDPNGKVRPRNQQELEAPISGGDALIATDQEGCIRFFAMASDHFQSKLSASLVTEIGGIMSDVGGFKLTQIASAMLALKQTIRLREEHPCLQSYGLHALVANNNEPARKVIGRDLKWGAVESPKRRDQLFDTQGKYSEAEARGSRMWFGFNNAAIAEARDLTMRTLHREALHSKRTGATIPLSLDQKAHALV